MDFAALVRARETFVTWCRHKEAVLDTTTRLFPPKHPLRIAVSRALCGDPLGPFRFVADGAACRAGNTFGDAFVTHVTGVPAVVDLFYGASLRALVATRTPAEASWQHSRRLPLQEFTRLLDTLPCAESFMDAARALARPRRDAARLDAAQQRFRCRWARALRALRGTSIDTSALSVVAAALRRASLPVEVASIVQTMLLGWPLALTDAAPGERAADPRGTAHT